METHIALNNLGITRSKEFAVGIAACTTSAVLGILMIVGILAATKGLMITAIVLGILGVAISYHAHCRPKTTDLGMSIPVPTVQVIQIGNVRLATFGDQEKENDDDSLELARAKRFLTQAKADLIAAQCCLAQ